MALLYKDSCEHRTLEDEMFQYTKRDTRGQSLHFPHILSSTYEMAYKALGYLFIKVHAKSEASGIIQMWVEDKPGERPAEAIRVGETN